MSQPLLNDSLLPDPNQTINKQDEEPTKAEEDGTDIQNENQTPNQPISDEEAQQVLAENQRLFQYIAFQAAMAGIRDRPSPAATITQAACSSVFGIVFGVLFLVYTCTSDLHGTDCGDLKDYCYEYGITIVIGTSLTFLLELCNSDLGVVLKSIIGICYGITSLVFWILLWVALAQDEACGELRTLALVYNWSVVGVLGLLCCCSITFLIFGNN